MKYWIICLVLLFNLGLLSAQNRHKVPRGEVVTLRSFATNSPELFFEPYQPGQVYPTDLKVIGQDSLGFLWMYNDNKSLYRFDGLKPREYKPEGIGELVVGPKSAASDAKNNCLWLSLLTGLGQFEVATGKMKTIIQPIGVKAVEAVRIDTFHNWVWVSAAKNGGVSVYDITKQRFLPTLVKVVKDGYSGTVLNEQLTAIYDIKVTADGVCWLTAQVGKNKSLCSYIPDIQQLSVYAYANDAKVLLLDNDKKRIWVSGGNGGLRCFDRQTRTWKQWLTPLEAANTVLDMAMWGNEALLLGTKYGALYFDKDKGVFSHHALAQTQFGNRQSHSVSNIMIDRQQNAWLTSYGLFKLDPRKQLFRHQNRRLPEGFAPAFVAQDSVTNQSFFVSGEGKIVIRNDLDGKWVSLSQTLGCQPTSVIAEQGKGIVWVGCSGGDGVIKFDLKTRKALPLPQNAGLFSGATCVVQQDPTGQIWVASSVGGLINLADPNKQKWAKLLLNQSLSWVSCSQKGVVWVSYNDRDAVTRIDVNKMTARHHDLSGNEAHHFVNLQTTADGTFWAASATELFCITPQSAKLEKIADLAPREGRISRDPNGNLWLVHQGYIMCYHAATKLWRSMSHNDGAPIITPIDNIAQSNSREMYFTDTHWWLPSELRIDDLPPQPVITALSVNEIDYPVPSDLNFTRIVNLQPEQNSFSIEFTALSYMNPDRNSYEYRMKDVTSDWVRIGSRRFVSFANLPPGLHVFRVRAANSDGLWGQETSLLRIYIKPHYWQAWWFWVVICGGILLAGALIFQIQLTEAKRKAQSAQKEAEFRQQVGELEMSALRSQMNPHFIFNVLNSINGYMLENDADSASLYLTKFARLVRIVLENSRIEYVTLEKDLAALSLYIELEALRFKQKVTYSFVIDPQIDTQFIKIPPLIIQPYVENAIWHGLMQRKEGGDLTIKINQPIERKLVVTIHDNGIGRTAAAELKSKLAVHQKSFGLEITSERLEMVNKIYHTNMTISIHDLHTPEGVAAGTSVELTFPI